jgi:hypothetical protein
VSHEHSAHASKVDAWKEVFEVYAQDPPLSAMDSRVGHGALPLDEAVNVWPRLVDRLKHPKQLGLHVTDRFDRRLDGPGQAAATTGDLELLVPTTFVESPDPPGHLARAESESCGDVVASDKSFKRVQGCGSGKSTFLWCCRRLVQNARRRAG